MNTLAVGEDDILFGVPGRTNWNKGCMSSDLPVSGLSKGLSPIAPAGSVLFLDLYARRDSLRHASLSDEDILHADCRFRYGDRVT